MGAGKGKGGRGDGWGRWWRGISPALLLHVAALLSSQDLISSRLSPSSPLPFPHPPFNPPPPPFLTPPYHPPLSGGGMHACEDLCTYPCHRSWHSFAGLSSHKCRRLFRLTPSPPVTTFFSHRHLGLCYCRST